MKAAGLALLQVLAIAGTPSLAVPATTRDEAPHPEAAPQSGEAPQSDETPLNFVLLMADDLGYGDVGFLGNEVVRTPNLDAMARDGVTLTRFYAASPVCSPTRGSVMTGRHPYRYGIRTANEGHLPAEEVTLAEELRAAGYATGFFGKWHLGTLTREGQDANRGGEDGAADYSPPWDHGFDVTFATESKVPTFDPMVDPETGAEYGTAYWEGPEQRVTENLAGDDSRVLMDRALPFVQGAVAAQRPFLAVVWFHAPHRPCVAAEEWRAPYADRGQLEQHYYGCISAMDEQIGRLRAELARLDVARNTVVWFCSDNGPETAPGRGDPGSPGPLRGSKRSLYEGGVRVPAVVVWPSLVEAGTRCDAPMVTSDLFPTLVLEAGRPLDPDRALDGMDVRALLSGRRALRDWPIGFQARTMQTWVADRYKLVVDLPAKPNGPTRVELYDLLADPAEEHDLAEERPRVVLGMRGQLAEWLGGFPDGP